MHEPVQLPGTCTVDVTPLVGRLAELQGRLDAMAAAEAKRIEDFERRMAALNRISPTAFNMEDGGCKPNDAGFDNGPVINAILARVGPNFPAGEGWPEKPSGWIRYKLVFPAGRYYFKTPIVFPKKTGITIEGAGVGEALHPNHDWAPNSSSFCAATSRLCWLGSPKEPAITIRGQGLTWSGINVENGIPGNPPEFPLKRDGSIGIRLTGEFNPASGAHVFHTLGMCGWDCAIEQAAGTQGDSNVFWRSVFQGCRTVYRCLNDQAVCPHFGHILVSGPCETVFDFPRGGGGLTVDNLTLMAPATLLRMQPEMNTCSYQLHFVKFDNMSKGWRLVDCLKPWGMRLRIAGEMGNDAAPGATPVRFPGPTPAAVQDVVIDIYDSRVGKAWDWKGAK